MKNYLLIFVAAMIAMTGCTANQSKKRYCHEKGTINAYIYDTIKNPCKVDFRYRNLSKHMQHPVVDIIVYDDAKELITHDKLYLEKINSGSAQQLTKVFECRESKIAEIYIRDAVNFDRCYGYKCSELCGIKGKAISVQK